MQNFWVTNKEHYGMLWYSLLWSIPKYLTLHLFRFVWTGLGMRKSSRDLISRHFLNVVVAKAKYEVHLLYLSYSFSAFTLHFSTYQNNRTLLSAILNLQSFHLKLYPKLWPSGLQEHLVLNWRSHEFTKHVESKRIHTDRRAVSKICGFWVWVHWFLVDGKGRFV